jgi:rhodanese-related sulfurtransferase
MATDPQIRFKPLNQNAPRSTERDTASLTLPNQTHPVAAAPVSIDAPTLKAWEESHDDPMVIDVRSSAEFDARHIKGSYHAPLPMLSEHTEEFAAKLGTCVVLVCQSGNRAEQARKHLDSVGLGGASVLAGGIGAGLTFSAATNSCAMGRMLSKMPWNRSAREPTAHQALQNLDTKA